MDDKGKIIFRKKIGERLLRRREELGLTQAVVADRMGPTVAVSTVQRTEKGVLNFTIDTLLDHCGAVNYPLAVLLALEDRDLRPSLSEAWKCVSEAMEQILATKPAKDVETLTRIQSLTPTQRSQHEVALRAIEKGPAAPKARPKKETA